MSSWLHRLHPNEREIVVYDCVDARVPILARMSEKRFKGYISLGYFVADQPARR